MTKVIYEPEKYRLCIHGHAGAAPMGKDVVCASASILGWTLLGAAMDPEEYHASYHLDEKTGLMDIRCEPEEQASIACRYLYEIIAYGFWMMADKYPDYVTFERSE